MLHIGLEVFAGLLGLLQLQGKLQKADVGGVGQARAVLGVGAGEAGLPEGSDEVIEAALRDAVDDRRTVGWSSALSSSL